MWKNILCKICCCNYATSPMKHFSANSAVEFLIVHMPWHETDCPCVWHWWLVLQESWVRPRRRTWRGTREESRSRRLSWRHSDNNSPSCPASLTNRLQRLALSMGTSGEVILWLPHVIVTSEVIYMGYNDCVFDNANILIKYLLSDITPHQYCLWRFTTYPNTYIINIDIHVS